MECGLDPALFWRLTLREMKLIFDGAALRLGREANDRIALAWHMAQLSRQEKIPPLARLIRKIDRGRQAKPDGDKWKREFQAFAAWAQARRPVP